MECFRPPDPSVRHMLRVAKITLTFMSIIMAIITIVIIHKSPTISRDYARLLYMIIILAAFFDVYSQFIFDPQYIMPYLCVYRDAPLFNIPLSPAWGFIIWITLFALNIPVYSAAFIHRHQVIVSPESLLKLRPFGHVITLALITGPSLTYGYAYYIAWDNRDEWIVKLLSSDWEPSIPTRMECMFQYAEIRNSWGAFLFLLSILIATSISLHTFHLIGQTRNLSTTTKSFHKMLMLSLISVAAVPILFIVAPFSSAMFYYLFLIRVLETKCSLLFLLSLVRSLEKWKISWEMNGSVPIMDIANVLIAFHSVIHSLVLIITTPVFRKLFLKIFCARSTCTASVLPSSARYEY